MRSFHSILILPRINYDEGGGLLFKVLPLSYSTSKLEYSDIIRILVQKYFSIVSIFHASIKESLSFISGVRSPSFQTESGMTEGGPEGNLDKC